VDLQVKGKVRRFEQSLLESTDRLLGALEEQYFNPDFMEPHR
jgi:hypothetical protein